MISSTTMSQINLDSVLYKNDNISTPKYVTNCTTLLIFQAIVSFVVRTELDIYRLLTWTFFDFDAYVIIFLTILFHVTFMVKLVPEQDPSLKIYM